MLLEPVCLLCLCSISLLPQLLLLNLGRAKSLENHSPTVEPSATCSAIVGHRHLPLLSLSRGLVRVPGFGVSSWASMSHCRPPPTPSSLGDAAPFWLAHTSLSLLVGFGARALRVAGGEQGRREEEKGWGSGSESREMRPPFLFYFIFFFLYFVIMKHKLQYLVTKF